MFLCSNDIRCSAPGVDGKGLWWIKGKNTVRLPKNSDATFLITGIVIAVALIAANVSGNVVVPDPAPESARETMRTFVGPETWGPLVVAAMVLYFVLHSPKLGMNDSANGCFGQVVGLISIAAVLAYFYVMVFGIAK